MPNPNPPADEQAAVDRGQYVRAWDKRIYIGEEKESDTLPEKCGFRFVVIHGSDNTKWSGYLWRE